MMRRDVQIRFLKECMDPTLKTSLSFVDAHRQSLLKNSQQASKYFYLASMSALSHGNEKLSVEFMKKSFLSVGLVDYLQHEFAQKQFVQLDATKFDDDFENSAMIDYLRSYLSKSHCSSSNNRNQSIIFRMNGLSFGELNQLISEKQEQVMLSKTNYDTDSDADDETFDNRPSCCNDATTSVCPHGSTGARHISGARLSAASQTSALFFARMGSSQGQMVQITLGKK